MSEVEIARTHRRFGPSFALLSYVGVPCHTHTNTPPLTVTWQIGSETSRLEAFAFDSSPPIRTFLSISPTTACFCK